MQKISEIGGLLKKTYRVYSSILISRLQDQGYLDLRPSFLEILMYVCEVQSSSIKEIGAACGLKKQTMTSHLNELEKRGYIKRVSGEHDRRELRVNLTEFGERFKLALIEVLDELDSEYVRTIGEVELDRILHTLENLNKKIDINESQQSMLL